MSGVGPDGVAGEPDDLGDITIPDDLSSLGGADAAPDLAVVLTQIAEATPLAALCSAAQVVADAVPTKVGAFAVLAERADGAPQEAVAALSTLIRGVPFVLVEKRGEQLAARRWQDGLPEDELAPGLVLGGAPEAIEDVLIGHASVDELEGVVASSSISRLKAMRMLTSAARKARKK
ncbi:hypothetical protein CLV28_2916 [Sediminihabitans luteus]|uniref:Uncharacterized protein n=1 Tax=Sediminihabitans luteus TaxID=1138585 RepID=A0A2M9CCQ0_9CELL|nr:hypothetical protein [Sediminihabitans luteus]PJJ69106.1 hypothetical protein CLV28_2916 [Sediminihabitans luteus]GII99492.1 hypothetical protein Slu03_18700 [Sediminihabitans luteus]